MFSEGIFGVNFCQSLPNLKFLEKIEGFYANLWIGVPKKPQFSFLFLPFPSFPFNMAVPTHWLIRVGDAQNFWRSMRYKIWSANSRSTNDKGFMKHVKQGDILWFVKTGGQMVAVATFQKLQERLLPLLSLTNEELGWYGDDGTISDYEIHYDNLFDIMSLKLKSGIKGACPKRKYNDKCQVNCPAMYQQIVRFAGVQRVL